MPSARMESLETYALQYLEDLAFDALLNRGTPVKPAELLADMPSSLEASPKLLRIVMADSTRFVSEERRWNLAIRQPTKQPVEGSLERMLRSYGRPFALPALINEMALVHQRTVEHFEQALLALIKERPDKYFQTDGRWGLREWLLDTSITEEPVVLMRNFFPEMEQALAQAEKLLAGRLDPKAAEVELVAKMIEKAGAPLHHKAISLALWKLKGGSFDSAALWHTLYHDSSFHLLSGALWAAAGMVQSFPALLEARSEQAEEAELPEEEEIPLALAQTDLDEIYAMLGERARPAHANDLAAAVFEVSPNSRRAAAAAQAINAALSQEERFRRVGARTWILPQLVPEYVFQVPPSLLPEQIDPSRLDDPEADAELDDEGLEPGLAEWVHDPRYEDFGEEVEFKLPPEQAEIEEIRCILPYDHWRVGTLRVRQIDLLFYPNDSELVFATLADEQKSSPVTCWVNLDRMLAHDLGAWYAAREMQPGSIFYFRKTRTPDHYTASYQGDIDPMLALDPERIAHLEDLRQPADKETWSVFELMSRLMADHRKGIHFMNLWAEVNVVRRTTRRVVASNLSSYHCFFPRPAGSETWVYDERRLSQGRKKAKRKYMKK